MISQKKIVLILGILFLFLTRKNVEAYSSNQLYGAWYNSLTDIPQVYNHVQSTTTLLGEGEVSEARSDTFILSNKGDSAKNTGQLFFNQGEALDLTHSFDFTFYFSLDKKNWNNELEVFFTSDKEIMDGKNRADKKAYPVKNALVFLAGKMNVTNPSNGLYFDVAAYNESGKLVSLNLINQKIMKTSSYLAPQNGTGSNTDFYQDAYKLYIPKELRGYSEATLPEYILGEDGVKNKPTIQLASIYNQQVLRTGGVGEAHGNYRKAVLHYVYHKGRGELYAYLYGFTPVKISGTIEEMAKLIGGKQFILGIQSTNKNDQDTGISGNTVVVAKLNDEKNVTKRKDKPETIQDEQGFLVKEPESFVLEMTPFGFQKKYKSNSLSLYIPQLQGVQFDVVACDSKAIPYTFSGRKLMASYNSGESIAFSDIKNYNQIPENSPGEILSKEGVLQSNGGVNTDYQKAVRYQAIKIEKLYLDLDGSQKISEKEKSNPENIYPITQGYYLIKQTSAATGFLLNDVSWLVHLHIDPKTREVKTEIYKRNNVEEKFELYNQTLATKENSPVESKGGNTPYIPLDKDNKTVQLGRFPCQYSEDVLSLYAQVIDEKTWQPIKEKSLWAFYEKTPIDGEFVFTGSKQTVNQWGFSSGDISVEKSLISSENGHLFLQLPRKNMFLGASNLFVLRQMKTVGKEEAFYGYYLLRIVNENSQYISKKDYALAYQVFGSVNGTHKEKMAELERLEPDYEFTGDVNKISTNSAKETVLAFFEKFDDIYGETYEEIPDIYRVNYSVDITYYPDGVEPIDTREGTPITEKEKEKDVEKFGDVIVYHYNDSITKKNMNNVEIMQKGNVFGTSSKKVENSNGWKNEIYLNLLNDAQHPFNKRASTSEKKENKLLEGDVLLVLILAFSILVCTIGMVIVVMKKKYSN